MFSHPSTYLASTTLSEVGERFLDVIVATIIYNIFYGLFVLLFYQSTAIFLTFLLATVYEGCLIAHIGPFVRLVLSRKEGGVVADKPRRLLRIFTLVGTWASTFEVCSSSLSPQINFLKGSLTVALDYGISDKILAAAIALSLGTNIVSTSLIGYIYWIHRRDVASCFHRGDRKTRGELVLATLMESGVVFCIFQAIFFALGRFPTNGLPCLYAERVFISLYIGFVTIYPTLVVVLVNNRRTVDQTEFLESSPPPITFHADADVSKSYSE
ncbi:hypothetical protein BDZ94DRAFT_1327744 [Collybia nuda]|uniref:Uncharacterized protein n=1 Tax=Collybia nuda TaxID=64659 RepID=A0A9P5YKH9_9AGAR|nr:hypothetical protein BDZ94DRAFT_1327744 [Collybia nuda]